MEDYMERSPLEGCRGGGEKERSNGDAVMGLGAGSVRDGLEGPIGSRRFDAKDKSCWTGYKRSKRVR